MTTHCSSSSYGIFARPVLNFAIDYTLQDEVKQKKKFSIAGVSLLSNVL